jgi:hypothetical protein
VIAGGFERSVLVMVAHGRSARLVGISLAVALVLVLAISFVAAIAAVGALPVARASGAAGNLGATAPSAGAPQPSPPSVAAHRRRARARADAKNLMSRLGLPAGAVALTHEPAGDSGALAQPITRPAADPALVDEHAWWRVPGSAASVLEYVNAHRPRGGKLTLWGSDGPTSGAPTSQFSGFSWPPVARLLSDRQLIVVAVDLTGGVAGVRVDAQVQWIVPRPVGERIPGGVHEIDVTRGVPGKAPSLSLKTVSPHVIRTLVAMVNSLEITQPGASSCPAVIAGLPVVTFTFRASDGGTVLATASQAASSREPTTACDPMAFSVRGQAETPLLGGAAVVSKAARLLGVHLQTPPGPGFATGAAQQNVR